MIVDDVLIFLNKGAENFSEDQIRYYLKIEQSKVPQHSLTELHLSVERGKVRAYSFVKSKLMELV